MKTFFTTLAFALLASASVSFAAPLKLCSGSTSGIYFEAATDIAKSVGRGLQVEIVETLGTSDNIERALLSSDQPDSCDALIVQPDGMVEAAKSSPGISKKIRQVGSLHREYLHVLCGKNSGVDDLGDLEDDPSKYSIAVGERGSGGYLVWQNLIREDEDYASVTPVYEGGTSALSSVAAGDVTCAIVPAGLKNGIMNDADGMFADDLVLVGANDKDFNDAVGFDGKPIYEYREIDGVYPNLQGFWGDVNTLSWNARVLINTEKVTDSKTRDAFIRAVSQAAVGIKGKYGK